jgi:hypothetical protein
MPPRLSEPESPQRRELTRALHELRQAADEHRRHIEASRKRSLWGSMKQGARAFTRFLGLTET